MQRPEDGEGRSKKGLNMSNQGGGRQPGRWGVAKDVEGGQGEKKEAAQRHRCSLGCC